MNHIPLLSTAQATRSIQRAHSSTERVLSKVATSNELLLDDSQSTRMSYLPKMMVEDLSPVRRKGKSDKRRRSSKINKSKPKESGQSTNLTQQIIKLDPKPAQVSSPVQKTSRNERSRLEHRQPGTHKHDVNLEVIQEVRLSMGERYRTPTVRQGFCMQLAPTGDVVLCSATANPTKLPQFEANHYQIDESTEPSSSPLSSPTHPSSLICVSPNKEVANLATKAGHTLHKRAPASNKYLLNLSHHSEASCGNAYDEEYLQLTVAGEIVKCPYKEVDTLSLYRDSASKCSRSVDKQDLDESAHRFKTGSYRPALTTSLRGMLQNITPKSSRQKLRNPKTPPKPMVSSTWRPEKSPTGSLSPIPTTRRSQGIMLARMIPPIKQLEVSYAKQSRLKFVPGTSKVGSGKHSRRRPERGLQRHESRTHSKPSGEVPRAHGPVAA